MITGGVEGVDYAFPPRPDLNALRTTGRSFICRYGGPGTIDKQLDPAEAVRATALGFKIVANAEGSADGLLGGFSVGASWARSAVARFKLCGMPTNRPIYFSADVNVTAAQWPAVADGLRGAASVVGLPNVGLYGHYNCMRWARRDDVARWFWQTYAWSGSNWAPGNHIEQYLNNVTVAGVALDLDRAINGDFGGWTVAKGTYDMIPISFGEGQAPAQRSSRVGAFQRALIRAGGDLTPYGGPDGRFGPGTRTVYQQVLGTLAGDGNLYDDVQYDALMAKAYGGTAASGGSVHVVIPGVDKTIPVEYTK